MRNMDNIEFGLKKAKAGLKYDLTTGDLKAQATGELHATSQIGGLEVDWKQTFDKNFNDNSDTITNNNGIVISRKFEGRPFVKKANFGDHEIEMIDGSVKYYHGISLEGSIGDFKIRLGAGEANSATEELIGDDITDIEIAGPVGNVNVRLQQITNNAATIADELMLEADFSENLPEQIKCARVAVDLNDTSKYALRLDLNEVRERAIKIEYGSFGTNDQLRVAAQVDKDSNSVIELVNTNTAGVNSQEIYFGYNMDDFANYSDDNVFKHDAAPAPANAEKKE
jgi:hypothetical protein